MVIIPFIRGNVPVLGLPGRGVRALDLLLVDVGYSLVVDREWQRQELTEWKNGITEWKNGIRNIFNPALQWKMGVQLGKQVLANKEIKGTIVIFKIYKKDL